MAIGAAEEGMGRDVGYGADCGIDAGMWDSGGRRLGERRKDTTRYEPHLRACTRRRLPLLSSNLPSLYNTRPSWTQTTAVHFFSFVRLLNIERDSATFMHSQHSTSLLTSLPCNILVSALFEMRLGLVSVQLLK